MLEVEKIDVWGFEHAIRGMRNPMNSWDKSDSEWTWVEDPSPINPNDPGMSYVIGQNDLDLMHRLYEAGHPHRKYLRQIFVSMDITAPLYWWKEFDTYKVGVVANSCSTMHKIHSKMFTIDDFSHEHLDGAGLATLECVIERLNQARKYFNGKYDNVQSDVDKKAYWWEMIQLLPTSYNQKRTITMNYENVVNIIQYRTGHKLDEWRDFVDILCGLPYIDEITREEKGNE